MTYEQFLNQKAVIAQPAGFSPNPMPSFLFDFQRDICDWAVKRGRSALLEDCGLGKSAQELVWADQVCSCTSKPVLLLAPLAVSQQFVREAAKFGIPVNLCACQTQVKPGINITNYEKLHHFADASAFGGIVLDESSILKGFDGKLRKRITDFARAIPYRLAATATAAPNDFMELGNHAEFLDVMTTAEMLATFFTHDGGDTSKWRLKGHAEDAFWRWVASWAVCIRRPSDLGYEDGGFVLPPLHMHQHTVRSEPTGGFLFPMEGETLGERHAARKESLTERVAECAGLVNDSAEQWLVWCNLNVESDALHYAIRDAVQVVGADSSEFKEKAVTDFVCGRTRVLVSKPSIFGFGLNLQQCSRMAFVGLSDSYEQFYQAVRRCWRFGQKNDVYCHVICAETEGAVVRNIQRKEQQAQQMFEAMVGYMKAISTSEIRGAIRERDTYHAYQPMRLPAWIRSEAA